MVRALTVQQLHEAAKMGGSFMRESGVPGRFVPEVFVRRWGEIIGNGLGFILGLFSGEKMVGAFGAVVAKDLNDDQPVANECFWFVLPDHRGRGLELLKAYEAEARGRGAVRCSMIHLLSLQPETLGKLYEARGYRPIEMSYFKELA